MAKESISFCIHVYEYMGTERSSSSLDSGWKKIPMASVWLHDGSVEGTGMLKNPAYFFNFFIGILGYNTNDNYLQY